MTAPFVQRAAYTIDLTVHECLANRKDGKSVSVDYRVCPTPRTADDQLDPQEPPEPIPSLWIAEFMCWTMTVLAPVLSWINGPSVSTDQFVVRTDIFVLALSGGIGLPIYKLVWGRRNSRDWG